MSRRGYALVELLAVMAFVVAFFLPLIALIQSLV